MYKIINLKRSVGEMNGYPYDNHNFTCLSDLTPKSLLAGTNVEVLKCNTVTYNAVITSRGYDVDTFPGMILEPVFNQYGKMVDFRISVPV